MKRNILLLAVALMTVLTLSSFVAPDLQARTAAAPAEAVEPGGGAGTWDAVCCGSLCPNGTPYCIGVGSYTCCR